MSTSDHDGPKRKPVPPITKPKPPVDLEAIRSEQNLAPTPAPPVYSRTELAARPIVSEPRTTLRKSVTVTGSVDDDADVKDLIRPRAYQLVDILFGLALDDAVKPADRIKAVTELMNRCYGKPGTVVESTEIAQDLSMMHLQGLRAAAKLK